MAQTEEPCACNTHLYIMSAAMAGQHRRDKILTNVAQLERSDTVHVKSYLNDFFERLSSGSDKGTRGRTKLEVLVTLRGLRGSEKRAAIDEVISALFSSQDACLQNYLADILLDLADPYGDDNLIAALVNNGSQLISYVREYINGRLGRNRKYTSWPKV